jgi:hypothetical protein
MQIILLVNHFSIWISSSVYSQILAKSSKGNMYILTATNYFTKWTEAMALNKVDVEELIGLIGFLKDNILSRFGVHDKFITENGSIFIGSKFIDFCGKYGIIMGQYSNYYPQGNDLTESANKTLVQILKKTIDGNQRNWHLKLIEALWERKTTPKDSIGMTPYLLVYGKEEKMPINLEINTLIFLVNTEYTEDTLPTQKRINKLINLEEEQRKSLNQASQRQHIIKKYFYKITTMKNFQKGEFVFLWNKAKENPSMQTNLEALWIGNYVVENILGFNSYMLQDMKRKKLMLHVNGKHLKVSSPSTFHSHCT